MILAAENLTSIAVVAAVFLVGGYLGLAALWFFVFRGSDGDDASPGDAGESQQRSTVRQDADQGPGSPPPP